MPGALLRRLQHCDMRSSTSTFGAFWGCNSMRLSFLRSLVFAGVVLSSPVAATSAVSQGKGNAIMGADAEDQVLSIGSVKTANATLSKEPSALFTAERIPHARLLRKEGLGAESYVGVGTAVTTENSLQWFEGLRGEPCISVCRRLRQQCFWKAMIHLQYRGALRNIAQARCQSDEAGNGYPPSINPDTKGCSYWPNPRQYSGPQPHLCYIGPPGYRQMMCPCVPKR